jgi:hypothetical protein
MWLEPNWQSHSERAGEINSPKYKRAVVEANLADGDVRHSAKRFDFAFSRQQN